MPRLQDWIIPLRVLLLSLFLLLEVFQPSVAEENLLTYHFREEQGVGSFVGNVARDSKLYGSIPDEEFRRLKFTFFTVGNPHAQYFSIDEKSSTIRTVEVIDRETICEYETSCVLNLDIAIYMRDVARNAHDLYKIMRVNVVIDDINDNPPTFPESSIKLSVPESVPPGHMLLTSGAQDRDTGQNNSIQHYELLPKTGLFELVEVDNIDGSADIGIRIKYQLDRETRDLFQVKVIALDGGYPPLTGTVIINITVTDVNDNRPAFLNSTFRASVYENVSARTPILKLRAIDQDDGPNGAVTYDFSNRVSSKIKESLRIDPVSGDIFATTELNFEKTKQYQFLVMARDQGSPPKSSQAAVIINVLDVNDNAPQININLAPEGTNISESEEPGKFIASVVIGDEDDGDNGVVTCAMDDPHFQLKKFEDQNFDSDIYKVLLDKPLDHETAPVLNVTITCHDLGRPPLSNSTSFTVHVIDANDNTPQFSQFTYSGEIIENNNPSEKILTVTAHDWDSGENGRVTYFLEPSARSKLSIDPDSGVIRANTMLDREDREELRFLVFAQDHGSSPKSASAGVVVKILDQNDEPPRFTRRHFYGYVLENQPPDTWAGNLTAKDPDSMYNARHVFSFVSHHGDSDFFSLDPQTGTIKTKYRFDREERDTYVLRVKVQDPQVPSYFDVANMTIYILDDNDHRPVITFPKGDNKTIIVPQTTEVGTIITAVQAYDADDKKFATLTYRIREGNTRNLFTMNSVSGEVAVAREIQLEDSEEYRLVISVLDSGRPPMETRTLLNLLVTVGNGTVLRRSKEEETQLNILIVIIIVIVTLLLAMAVVVTICLIKRIDRERQADHIGATKVEEKMFTFHPQECLTTRDSNENEADKPEKNGRMESSFCMETDGHHGNHALNTSDSAPLSTFKMPGEQTSRMSAGSRVTTLSRDGALAEGGRGNSRPLTPARDADSPIAVSIQMPTPHQHATVRWAPDPVKDEEKHLMELLKKGDDAISESSGESGTSDSGRGNSEDEVNTSRSAVPESEMRTFPLRHHTTQLSRTHSPSTATPSNGSLPQGRPPSYSPTNNNLVQGRQPSKSPITATMQGKQPIPNYYGGRRGPSPSPRITSRDDVPPPPLPVRARHHESQPNLSGRPCRQGTLSPSPGDWCYPGASIKASDSFSYVPMSPLHKNAGAPRLQTFGTGRSPSHSSELGGHLGGRCTPSSRGVQVDSTSCHDDDDMTTTTSGSYTVNPEDLKGDMDAIFLQDVVV